MSLRRAGKIGNDDFLSHPKTDVQFLHITVATVHIDFSMV